jgi:hypothetical protein
MRRASVIGCVVWLSAGCTLSPDSDAVGAGRSSLASSDPLPDRVRIVCQPAVSRIAIRVQNVSPDPLWIDHDAFNGAAPIVGGTGGQRIDPYGLDGFNLDVSGSEDPNTRTITSMDLRATLACAYTCGSTGISKFFGRDLRITSISDGACTIQNPIDDARFFTRQQYLDLLNRKPDLAGLDYWTSQITSCGSDASCVTARRTGVAAAFFSSPEFGESAGFVYRLFKGALGRRPAFTEFTEFRNRMRVLSGTTRERQLALVSDLVSRNDFQLLYPASLSNTEYVDRLIQTAGFQIDGSTRANLIAGLDNQTENRSTVLHAVVNAPGFEASEQRREFILMEYFGHLRRDPDEAGYDYWLGELNAHNDFSRIVGAFIDLPEYRGRFNPF